MIRRIAVVPAALALIGVPALAQVRPTAPVASKSYVDTSIQSLYNSISGSFAPLASPIFTGTATMPAAAIGGGTINGAAIGGTTPAAGAFTTLSATTPLAIASGGTGSASASAARSALGVAASGANSDLTSLAGLTTPLSLAQGGTGANSAATARTSLGLGTLATQGADGVAITGGAINGTAIGGTTRAAGSFTTLSASTPLPLASGGTGGATAAAGRSGLGAAASGANTDITSLGGLTTALSVAQGGTGATGAAGARSSLGLGSVATQDAGAVALTGGTINGVALGGTTPAAAALSTLSVTGTSSLAGDAHVGGGTNNIGLSRALTLNHPTGTTGIIFQRNGLAAAYFATDGTSFAQLLSASASVPVLLGAGNAATFKVQQNATTTTKPLQLPASTVANLPACNSGLQDSLAVVSDATNPSYRGSLTGGGSVRTAAYCDGTSWTAR